MHKEKLLERNGAMDWVRRWFADVDTKRVEALEPWLADTIEMRFANAAPVHGKQLVLDALAQFYATITGMRHAAERILIDGDHVAQFAQVTYTDLSGRETTLPVATYLHRTGEKIDRLAVYIDMAPLHAAA